MTEREQILWLRERTHAADRASDRLFKMLCSKERERCELKEANANLRVERDAADVLLGSAMDAALEAQRR